MQSTVDLCQLDERNVSKTVIFDTYSAIFQGFGGCWDCWKKQLLPLIPAHKFKKVAAGYHI